MTVYAYLYDHESKKVFVLVKLDVSYSSAAYGGLS
jgi:hypothetical protein